MATTRKQDLTRMAATLEAWAGQIADLQAKARTAGAEQRLVVGSQIAALRQQRRGEAARAAGARGGGRARRRGVGGEGGGARGGRAGRGRGWGGGGGGGGQGGPKISPCRRRAGSHAED